MTAALEGGEWSAARPGRTLPPGKIRYPFYRRLLSLFTTPKITYKNLKYRPKNPNNNIHTAVKVAVAFVVININIITITIIIIKLRNTTPKRPSPVPFLVKHWLCNLGFGAHNARRRK